MKTAKYVLAGVFGLIALVAPRTVRADTFTVLNLNDSGPGSLRAEIAASNASGPGPNVIDFDILGGGAVRHSLDQRRLSSHHFGNH
jgi:hypothetical protein